MPALDRQPDQKRIVAFLAQESHLSIDDVATLYERERATLALGAHLAKFLHIFAIRNVQDILRERRLGAGASMSADPALLAA